MSKKSFVSPFVLLVEDEENPTVIGHGSGQGTPDVVAWDFDTWLNMGGGDYFMSDDAAGTYLDYVEWWYQTFGSGVDSQEAWAIVNGGTLPERPTP